MGNTIWVDMQGPGGDELRSDNSILLALEHELMILARKLSQRSLMEFYDDSELNRQIGEMELELPAGWDDTTESWFNPADALPTVIALRARLAEHPEDLAFKPNKSQRRWHEDLLQELAHCQSVLETAIERGRQFRLLIVP